MPNTSQAGFAPLLLLLLGAVFILGSVLVIQNKFTIGGTTDIRTASSSATLNASPTAKPNFWTSLVSKVLPTAAPTSVGNTTISQGSTSNNSTSTSTSQNNTSNSNTVSATATPTPTAANSNATPTPTPKPNATATPTPTAVPTATPVSYLFTTQTIVSAPSGSQTANASGNLTVYVSAKNPDGANTDASGVISGSVSHLTPNQAYDIWFISSSHGDLTPMGHSITADSNGTLNLNSVSWSVRYRVSDHIGYIYIAYPNGATPPSNCSQYSPCASAYYSVP